MSLELSDENLKSAYFRTLIHAGVKIFESNEEEHFFERIPETVPVENKKNFPHKLRQSAVYICTRPPYLWHVDDTPPHINEFTTYEDLYNRWFKIIVI